MSKTGTSKPAKKKNSVVYKYNYYDSEGKRRCKSFSAPTMREAMRRAARWEAEHPQPKKPSKTVLECVDGYLVVKESVLSPSTYRTYKGIKEKDIEGMPIGSKYISELTRADVQAWVSELAKDKKPKTVRNCYALLVSSVKMYDDTIRLDAQLPAPVKADNYCPSDADIQKLIQSITDRELLIAVYLGAFGLLRRGEICALESTDIKGNTVHIHKALVKNELNVWEEKAPKTLESDRYVELPDFVIKELKKSKGRFISCTPDAIGLRFRKALKRAGIHDFRFHDLRHYGASILHAIGVPDLYIMQYGGWSSDHVMKRVYRNLIGEEQRKQTEKIKGHFEQFSPLSEKR